MPRLLLALGVVALWATAPVRRAVADGNYEDGRVAVALSEAGLTVDDVPAGKRIAFVRLVRHDVLVEDELWPTWPNIIHTLTDADVIEREYLFAAGEAYDDALIDETERNLRMMGIFALVRVVPVKTNDPATVGVLVHTRDLWSLRIEQDFQITGGVLDRLLLQGTERNLAGRNKAVVARFQMNPITFSLGQQYVDRRMFLGTHRLEQEFDVFFNRGSGAIEGSQGKITAWLPYYSLAQRLSYRLDAQYVTKIARVLQTGAVATYDVPETTEVESIDRVWDDRSGAVVATGTIRDGDRYKYHLTFGAGFRDRQVTANELTGLPDEHAAAFARDVLPRVRREVFPTVGVELFEAQFETYRELATYGQSENVRVGPSLSMTATLPLRAWGSSTNSATLIADAGYVLAYQGGLFEAAVRASGRHESGVLINRFARVHLRSATPILWAGRLVFRWLWEGRQRDTNNTAVWLGGDNGLRGYPSQALIGYGANRVLTSLEYRTRPITWESVQVGMVLFYDAGSVYERLREARMRHAVGTGVRILFPQLNRYAFRADLGVPLGEPGVSVLLSFGSNQAVPLTATEDDIIEQQTAGQ